MKIKASIVYQIDVTNLAGEIVNSSFNLQTPEEAMALVKEKCVNDVIIYVNARSFTFERGGYWWELGTFALWFNSYRVYVIVYSHQSHTAFDLALPVELTHDVWFLDERPPTSVWKFEQTATPKIEKFAIPFNETISLGQTIQILKFWLPNQENFPLLEWRFA